MDLFKCQSCRSAFVRPMNGKCPMCGNPNFDEGVPMNPDLRYTGKEKDGKHLYKDVDTGKEKWLGAGDENVKEQKKPTETTNKEIADMNKRLNKKKQQSDYHKERYKKIKAKTWKGHL